MQAWKPFLSLLGDHITKLNVYKSFLEVWHQGFPSHCCSPQPVLAIPDWRLSQR